VGQLAKRHNIGFAGVASIIRVRGVIKEHLKDASTKTSEGSAAADALLGGSLSNSQREGTLLRVAA
jgi:hypothetical protein